MYKKQMTEIVNGTSKLSIDEQAQLISEAINKRFYMFDKGIKVGVAKAKDDKYIELKLHPRYKDNVERYMQVVRSRNALLKLLQDLLAMLPAVPPCLQKG